ncbi:hypothetical protein [Enterococcus mediterraneensis]|uniref:hypothetical protein n=1 Tax=Enterococcus mediterraneensis TaxID=2364791 RepID=UPI000F05D4E6|nr:hypothetical protein [Enterococcus mediterraneensis]
MSTTKTKALSFQISYVSDDAIEELTKGILAFHQKDVGKMVSHIKQEQEHLAKARALQLELFQEDMDHLPYSINDFHVVDNFCEALQFGRYSQFLMEVLETKQMRELRKLKQYNKRKLEAAKIQKT